MLKHPLLPADDDTPVDQSVLLQSVGYNCLHAYLELIAEPKKKLAELGLRPVEYTILSVVKRNPGISQKRLGETIRVSPPNLATVLDRLENAALLSRQRNPLDKRSQILVLSEQGLQQCKQAETAVLQSETTPQLNQEEKNTLLHLLQKIFLPSIT